MAQKLDKQRRVSCLLTIYDANKEVVIHCHFVLVVVFSDIGSNAGHGGEIERRRPDQSVRPSIKQRSPLPADSLVDIRCSRCQSVAPSRRVYINCRTLALWSCEEPEGAVRPLRRTKEASLESKLMEAIWFK